MGLFPKLFGSSSGIEKQLEDQYIPMLQMRMGMSLSQAKSTFRDLIKMAKEQCVKEGTSKFPQNFGDIVLREESTNPHYRSFLTRKRSEGVRDEDIKWWWNMHDLEKSMMVQVDNWFSFSLFLKLREEGFNEEEAGKRVKKSRPIFGDPDDPHVTGEDRPLPHELRNRIDIYVEKRSQTDKEKFKNETEESSSFNALIRKEIKNGKV